MANFGGVDKLFYVYGDRANNVVTKFTMYDENKFYLAPFTPSSNCTEYAVIDVSGAGTIAFSNWLNEIPQTYQPIVFLINDSNNESNTLAVKAALSLKLIVNVIIEIKNHEQLVSVLEALSGLQNGFSVMEVDEADFVTFLTKGQHYYSDLITANSVDELKKIMFEKLEVINGITSNQDLRLAGVFGCIKKESDNFTIEEYEYIAHAIQQKIEEKCEFVIHSNLKERMFGDNLEKTELHMLWILS